LLKLTYVAPSPSPSPTPKPAVPLSLEVSPSSISFSGSTTLTWKIIGSTSSCNLSRNLNGVSISGAWSGIIRRADVTPGTHSRSITLTNSSTTIKSPSFSISCKIDNVIRSVTASVTVNPATKPTVTLSANPTSLKTGKTTILTWVVGGNAKTCALSSSGNATVSGSWNGSVSGVNVTAGTHTRSLTLGSASGTRSRTFNIYCNNTGGNSSTSSVTVSVSK